MEVKKLRTLVIVVVAFGMLIGESSASFKDCYAKCFIFCMIDPSKSLCSCTTSCLKSCIFSDISESSTTLHEADTKNYNFCKLGCAFSTCSAVSSKQKPNAEKVDDCVGSCSKICTKNYLSP